MDFGSDDVEAFVTHHYFCATFGICLGADLMRRATVVPYELDARCGFAVQQYAHRQWFTRTDVKRVVLRHND
ncbi:hypothetical protein D3C80_1176680 [compost metagenome]